jgi:hypothetical protein
MDKIINKWGKPYYENATEQDEFNADMFYEVDMYSPDCGNRQWALHTSLGSLTVVARMTGYGWHDIESGFRSPDKKFWLASGYRDVRRSSGAKTLGEAIEWVKAYADICKGTTI